MQIFRIDSIARQHDSLTGIGAELYGGRWNRIGERAVYCASHRSLAILEILAHVRNNSLFPVDRVMLDLEIPVANIFTFKAKDLAIGWNDATSYRLTEGVFEQFCILKNRLAIRVPSVIVPEEYNIVLNPAHERFKDVKVMKKSALAWDDRLI